MADVPKRRRVHVNLREDLADRVEAMAEERVIGPGLLIEWALDYYLDDLPPLPPRKAGR